MCDTYKDCHNCTLANCRFDSKLETCGNKTKDGKYISESEILTVAEFFKEGSKCEDKKKACHYPVKSDLFDGSKHANISLKIKEGTSMPPNYFCI